MMMSLNPVSRHRSSQFQESSLRPFYFTVVFWGAEHRAYFTDLLVASLLSPNNIPALKKERRSKFLIVTTLQDWRALQDHVLFRRLCLYVEPIFFEMPFPQKGDLKMLVMSKGHKQVSMKAYEDQAYGVYVTPDLVLSDGSVSAMERLAEEGKKVVLCVAIRFQQETILPELEQKGFLAPGCPLSMSSRELMDVALKHLHSETLRYEFEAPYFADSPISVYWWTVPGQRMIIHSFSWAPLVVDYGALKHHDTQTFENWTLDGDYIHRNFPNPGDVYVVTDSDEISLVSFTKEADLHFDLVPEPKKAQYGILTHVYKVGLIRALKDSLIMDPLKRYIFPKGVLLHSDASDPHKSEEGKHVEQVIRDAHDVGTVFPRSDRSGVNQSLCLSDSPGITDGSFNLFSTKPSPEIFLDMGTHHTTATSPLKDSPSHRRSFSASDESGISSTVVLPVSTISLVAIKREIRGGGATRIRLEARRLG